MKLLLSVYYKDYHADINGLKASNAFHNKKQVPIPPNVLGLDVLRSYFESKSLIDLESQALVALTQQRRDAIHAYLTMLRNVNGRLPYPDEQYVPQETAKW